MYVVEKGTAGSNERTVFHRAVDGEPSEREAFEKWAKEDMPELRVPQSTFGLACAFRAGWRWGTLKGLD